MSCFGGDSWIPMTEPSFSCYPTPYSKLVYPINSISMKFLREQKQGH